MVVDLIEKWASEFAILGSEERLSILIVLSGSDYIRHDHRDLESPGCLSFTQIGEAAEITSNTRLSYHLSKLIEAELVERIPAQDKKGRVFPLYRTTLKWRTFASDFGIDTKIKDYVRKKYPDAFVNQ